MPAPERQLYLGIDVGRITGTEQYGNGKVMSGATVGIRGSIISTQYDLFIGTPLIKPNGFHTDPAKPGIFITMEVLKSVFQRIS